MEMFKKKVLTRLQQGIPVEKRPFARLADELHSSEEDLIVIILKLMDDGIIRDIAPIFETEAMGYESTLAGAKIDDDKLSEVASFLSEHPGVTHNYKRDNEYNLWFTLTVPKNGSLDKTLNIFRELNGVEELLKFDKEKTYKVRVAFDLTGENPSSAPVQTREITKPNIPEDIFRRVVLALQQGLPISRKPFDLMAKRAKITEDKFILTTDLLMEHGVIRRFPAMLKHKKAGINYNAMIVWQIDDKKVDEMGSEFSKLNYVTHCYKRKTYDSWAYNLYTMTHAKDKKEWAEYFEQMKETAKSRPCLVLESLKEYKKTRVKYFDPKLDEWNSKYLKNG